MPAELPENRAVVDRIDGGVGVLLAGPLVDQHDLDAVLLPDGAGEEELVAVTIERNTVVIIEVDRELTGAWRAGAEQWLARIRGGRSSGRFN